MVQVNVYVLRNNFIWVIIIFVQIVTKNNFNKIKETTYFNFSFFKIIPKLCHENNGFSGEMYISKQTVINCHFKLKIFYAITLIIVLFLY